MTFVLQFIFYMIFFFLKLYSLLDKNYIFSANGGKLKKYIKSDDLQNITCNLGVNKIKYLFNQIKSSWSSDNFFIKKILNIILITFVLLILKICFTYNFLFSNFLYLNIFNKNFDIALILGEYYTTFKILYYILYTFFILNVTNYTVNLILSLKNNKNSKEKDVNELAVNIGEVVDNNIKGGNNNEVLIYEQGLYQNILITGSIGSGKTSSAISNILLTLIKNNIYGLVIDVKGNYANYLKKILQKNNMNKKIVEISLSDKFKYNPLDKNEIASIELASRIKQVMLNLSKNNTSDSYWIDKAEEYIRNFITLIRAYGSVVSFKEIHMLVINKEYLFEKINLIKKKILENSYTDDELFNINSAILNIKNEYLKLDERTIGIIKSEITRCTNIFMADKRIYDTFCENSDVVNFLSDTIYVLSLNIGENKLLTKIISSYLKLDYQKQILSQYGRYKKTFFVSDEYQEIATEDDANFFSLSREYKSINVISMQSYSSLLNTLSNENSSRVIIQNLVNKIWFRNDDMYTVSEIIKQVGKEEKKRETVNYSENSQNSKYNLFLNNFVNVKSGLSKSISISQNNEYLLTEEYLTRTLKTFEACMMLSDGNNIEFIKKVKLRRCDI